MRRLFPVLLFISSSFISIQGQFFTIGDIEQGIETYLKPQTIENIQWHGNMNKLLYSDDTLLYSVDIVTGEESIISLTELNQLVKGNSLPELKSFPPVKCKSNDQISFQAGSCLFLFNINDKSSRIYRIPDTAQNVALSPRLNAVAYTLGNNLFIQDSTTVVRQISFDSLDGITNGDIVYRNEFGITTGLFWSPEGNYLAYYRKDESGVSKYPFIDIDARVAKYNPARYPMAGMKSEETDIWIYSLADKSYTKLNITGDREQYHTNLSWSTDETEIYLQHLNRDQDSMVLKSYWVKTGELSRILFSETDERYVEPQNPLVFSTKIPGDFIYQSERSGFNHLYYYSAPDSNLKQLTTGSWDVTGFKGYDHSEQFIFFMANKDNPLESHLYKLDRNSGDVVRLTQDVGTHEVMLDTTRTHFIDEYSSYTIPNRILLCSTEGGASKELLSAGNPVENYKLGEVINGMIYAGDKQTKLYYRLTKPVNFKSSKKYPVLVYVYGGPHLQMLTNSWMDRQVYFEQYLAQHGIATFTIDTRGSDNRGRAFEDIIHRQSGIPQLSDVMEGVEFLKSLSYIDVTRIGIHGWSYGGFLTIFLMENYPGVFKAGVAGGPVTNWKYYEVMYGERYMDTPEQNPEGYEKTDLIGKAGKLEGKLLIIHGGIDPVVVPQQSLLFLQEAIKQDKDIEYFVYPGHEHNVDGKDRVHLTRMITSYFINNL